MDTFHIEALTFTYPGRSEAALKEVSFRIPQGAFVVLCGASGCGKTTLLRQLKPALRPHGEREGQTYYEGRPLEELDPREQAGLIGFVQQSPEHQIVTDKVWHELAFGLESLGLPSEAIRLRIAETASFFGIEAWFHRPVKELSGGQKQLLNLAAVMTMQPGVLILDEPTAQLDPIAAGEFLGALSKINRELGVTVLLSEHRLEEALPLADEMIVMESGHVIAQGPPREVGQALGQTAPGLFLSMPTPMRIYACVPNDFSCPLTIREGRTWLDAVAESQPLTPVPPAPAQNPWEPVIALDEVWFRYEREGSDVVKDLSMEVFRGECYAILGGNGVGKTTTLSLISGLQKPCRGTVSILGSPLEKIPDGERYRGLLGVLPQNPQALFSQKTVELDLGEMLSGRGLSKEAVRERVGQVAELCQVAHLLGEHPYDLSGGEQQRAALAKVLLLEPQILILDEPTKGMDGAFKAQFARILKGLQTAGVTILMVSHDVEFCARWADRCAMFFDGKVTACHPAREFFSGNSYYTTAANRMARHKLREAVTVEDVVAACGGILPPEEGPMAPLSPVEKRGTVKRAPPREKAEKLPLSPKRKWLGLGLIALSVILAAVLFPRLNFMSGMEVGFLYEGVFLSHMAWLTVLVIALLGSLLAGGFAALFYGRGRPAWSPLQVPKEQRRLQKRTLVAAGLILLLIPITIWVGYYYLGDRKYYFISLLILLETMLPFVMVYEGRRPAARELVIIAALCGIAIGGRVAFFWMPQFKPVVAVVILAGVCFGGETGFLVGAVTGFVSNFYFGQGPWTPWQMFAFGIIGFLAGVLFRKGLLRHNVAALCIFGGFATYVIYGGIMNLATVLMFQGEPTVSLYLSALFLAVPFDLIHAEATVLFLLFGARPLLEKLDRVKEKYGLVEDPND